MPTVPMDWIRAFDFPRQAISLPGEPGTGRLQVRAVLEVRCTNLTRTEAKTIEEKAAEILPSALELFDNSTGKTTVVFSQKPREIVVDGSI